MEFKIFNHCPELKYGFSGREDGPMKWLPDPVAFRPAERNRKRFFGQFDISPDQVVTADIVHSARVVSVGVSEMGAVIPQTDGLVSKEKDVFLTITAADCFPIYFYEPESRTIGLVHAGWRGIVNGIVPAVVKVFGRVEELLVGIGAGIRACHFEISPGDSKNFAGYPEAVEAREGKTFVNLPFIIQKQLEKTGVRREGVEDSSLCTYCLADRYFSFRRDKPKDVQAMIAYIGRV